MKYIDLEGRQINESQIDLSKGSLHLMLVFKEDAEPIDNITKFAYSEDDYEEVYMYVPNRKIKPTQLDIIEAQVTYTAMMTDTLLEE